MLSQEAWDNLYKKGETTWREPADINELIDKSGVRNGATLDLGCGTGEWAIGLDNIGFKVEGLDYSQEALSVAMSQKSSVSWAKWDLEELNKYEFKNEKYDLILDHKVLAFISNKNEYLDEIKKRLSGKFVITVFHEHEKTGICISKAEFDRLVLSRFTPYHTDIYNPRPGKVFATYYLSGQK